MQYAVLDSDGSDSICKIWFSREKPADPVSRSGIVFRGDCDGVIFLCNGPGEENEKQLAVVEATQSGEVVFTLLGGILVLGEAVPGPVGAVGLVLIIGGMIFNSIL